MTNQFFREEQYRDLVTVTRPSGGLKINVDNINGYSLHRRQGSQVAQHFLAKASPRAGVQQEPHP